MAYKKYGRAPKRKLRFRKKGKKLAKKPLRGRPRLRATIKDVVRREVETKYIGYGSPVAITVTPYKAGAWGFFTELGPGSVHLPVYQGINVSERVGNKIETKRLNLRLFIMPNKYENDMAGEYNTNPKPFFLIIYIGYKKNSARGNPQVTFPYDWSKFYTYGNTDVEPTGTLTDTFKHTNGDLYHICKKDVIKCGYQHQYSNLGQAAVNVNDIVENNHYFNNDFKSVIKRNYDLTKYYNKNVTFDDQNLAPTNRGLYMWAQAVSIDGTVNGGQDIESGHLCKMWYEQRYEYKDA